MKIVRMKLTADDISSPSTRYNPDTDTVQVTPDNGTTWTDVPELDARHSDAARLPPLSGGTAQCDAAARMTAQLKATVDGFIGAVSFVEAVSLIFSIFIVLADGLGAVLYTVAYLVAAALGVIGASAIAAAFTSDVWDGIKCIIFNRIGSDGQMSAAQLADIMTDIDAAYPGTVYNVLQELRGLYGEVQLSNAGVSRTETGDCDACEPPCLDIDFAVNDGGFSVINPGQGIWVSGTGWEGQDEGGFKGLRITRSMDMSGVNRWQLVYSVIDVTGSTDNVIRFRESGATVYHFNDVEPEHATFSVRTIGAALTPVAGDALWISVDGYTSVTIHNLRLWGTCE